MRRKIRCNTAPAAAAQAMGDGYSWTPWFKTGERFVIYHS